MRKEVCWQKYIWLVLIVLFIIFIAFFRVPLAKAMIPFFVALIFASMIEPLITFLERKLRLNRTPAAILSLVLALSILTLILTLVLIYGINQIWTLASQLPKNQQAIATDITSFFQKLRDFYPKLPPEYIVYIESILSNAFNSLQVFITRTLNRILTWAASLPNLFIVILITILSAYFMAKDRHTISRSILGIIPTNWQKEFSSAAAKAISEIIGFIKGQLFLSFLTLILSSIFMGFFIKSPYWMLLSLILAVLDLIPVMGPGLILMPWAIIALFLGQIKITWILVILYVLIIVTRQGLQPKVLGSYTGIHPLLMLFSIYAGLLIFGVWGLFIGPILVIVVRASLGFLKNIQKV